MRVWSLASPSSGRASRASTDWIPHFWKKLLVNLLSQLQTTACLPLTNIKDDCFRNYNDCQYTVYRERLITNFILSVKCFLYCKKSFLSASDDIVPVFSWQYLIDTLFIPKEIQILKAKWGFLAQWSLIGWSTITIITISLTTDGLWAAETRDRRKKWDNYSVWMKTSQCSLQLDVI